VDERQPRRVPQERLHLRFGACVNDAKELGKLACYGMCVFILEARSSPRAPPETPDGSRNGSPMEFTLRSRVKTKMEKKTPTPAHRANRSLTAL
jgi:hypothetical protein